jgi:hypothetical protein
LGRRVKGMEEKVSNADEGKGRVQVREDKECRK